MLPYGVKAITKTHKGEKVGKIISVSTKNNIILGELYDGKECFWLDYGNFTPYLRPLSSMTNEEKQESRWYRHDIISDNFLLYMNRYAEWLDSKHFDWRTDGNGKTMIEKGLALEAPEGMYQQ